MQFKTKDNSQSQNQILEAHAIPVVFAANDYFVPYMAAMLLSLADHASKGRQYEIIVLHRDILGSNQAVLRELLLPYENIRLRFVEMAPVVGDTTFFVENKDHFSPEAYYRLFIPYILPEYDKAVYLDGDMIALRDIAELYDTDISDFLIAAVRDYAGNSLYEKPLATRKKYREQELGLTNLCDYFISGTLVLNLEALRKEKTMEEMLAFAASRNWMQHDQDILNVLCSGKTRILDAKWNVLEDYGNNRYLPQNYYDEWLAGHRNPAIVHYGGERKPWLSLNCENGELFWRYAAKTPWLKTILQRMNEVCIGPKESRYAIQKQYWEGKIGFAWLVRFGLAWLKHKFTRRTKGMPPRV